MTSTLPLLGLTAYPYGLIVGGAAILYLMCCGLTRYKAKLPSGTTRIYALLSFPIGLVLSRLLFCLFSLNELRDGDGMLHFEWMLRFFDGGYSLIGLMAGLFIAAFFASRIMKVRFGRVADAMTVPMGLFVCLIRIGEELVKSQEGEQLIGFGKYMEANQLTKSLPFLFATEELGVTTQYLPMICRLEAAAGFLIFIVMMLLYFLPKKSHARMGDLALIFYTLFGASQVMLEYLRNDGHMWLNFAVRGTQILAALMPLIATILFASRIRRIKGKRLVPTLAILASVVMLMLVALMEFSIDGRITLVTPNQTRDYIILGCACIGLMLIPCLLWRRLCHSVYLEDVIGVKIA